MDRSRVESALLRHPAVANRDDRQTGSVPLETLLRSCSVRARLCRQCCTAQELLGFARTRLRPAVAPRELGS
ncbi:MAG: hypothetical protein IPL59_17055 [Candidatus Competibacteraceae bacterium]|nr:hypothetical protein [Candidatus Competibacteraceae bacterium]